MIILLRYFELYQNHQNFCLSMTFWFLLGRCVQLSFIIYYIIIISYRFRIYNTLCRLICRFLKIVQKIKLVFRLAQHRNFFANFFFAGFLCFYYGQNLDQQRRNLAKKLLNPQRFVDCLFLASEEEIS